MRLTLDQVVESAALDDEQNGGLVCDRVGHARSAIQKCQLPKNLAGAERRDRGRIIFEMDFDLASHHDACFAAGVAFSKDPFAWPIQLLSEQPGDLSQFAV